MNPDDYEVLFGDPPASSQGAPSRVVVELEPVPSSGLSPERPIESRPASIGFSNPSRGASPETPPATPQVPAQGRSSKPNPWMVALASGGVAGALFLGLLIAADTPRQPQPCQEDVIYPAVLGTTELKGDSTTTASLDIDAIVTTTTADAGSCIPND